MQPAVDLDDPGQVGAVVEAHAQIHVDGHPPGDAFDDAHDLDDVLAADRHEVDDAHDAFVGRELGLEDECVAAVATLDLPDPAGGRELPDP